MSAIAPIRIAHFTEAPMGGVQAHMEELIAEQLRDPAFAHIAVFGPDITVATMASWRDARLSVISYPYRGRSPWAMIKFLQAARKVIAAQKPDILHLHSTFAGFLLRPLARLVRPRPAVVYCPHGWAFLRNSRIRRLYAWLEAHLASCCEAIVCVSSSEREAAVAAGIDGEKCAVIPNGIAENEVAPDLMQPDPARWSSADDAETAATAPRTILFVGRFDFQKGFDVFLDVLSDLGPEAKGLAVGDFIVDGADPPRIPANVAVLGWRSRVEVAACLHRADLLLMPSRWEGLPMIAIEAMRAGLPLFASTAGGLAEMIEDGVSGRHLASMEPADIANTIRATTAGQLARFASNARLRFREFYTARAMATRMDALYRDILEAGTQASLQRQ
ncbi:MAG: glycosyltransferase family 4 protein [Alphaproteobacteria bacterium]|nr:glycosyltransferase family 4 protein [Alphaproteobacteria bacterium]